MRHLLCKECGEGQKKENGVRKVFEREYEQLNGVLVCVQPAEFERIQWGTARHPKLEQRVMYVNGVPTALEPDHYTCDSCSAAIRLGDRCCAHTAWREDQEVVRPWEHEFIQW